MRRYSELMKRLHVAALWLSALVSACAPLPSLSPVEFQPPTPGSLSRLPPRPKGSPDVLIFGVSGRCGPPCQAPDDNWDYLTERGTLEAVAQVFRQRGLKVQVEGYAERVATEFTSRRSKLPQRGILDLLGDYQRLTGAWVLGRRNPARVVLVGHSHGAVWAHYLTTLFGQVPVAALIDLDANCVAWNVDHSAETLAATSALWRSDPQRSPLLACSSAVVDGQTVRLKDLVWPNVALNLEVQSKRLPKSSATSPGLYVNYLFDLTPNSRPDGSTVGIETFVAVREDHSAVAYPYSQAMGWVREQLQALPWLAALKVVPGKPAPFEAPAVPR